MRVEEGRRDLLNNVWERKISEEENKAEYNISDRTEEGRTGERRRHLVAIMVIMSSITAALGIAGIRDEYLDIYTRKILLALFILALVITEVVAFVILTTNQRASVRTDIPTPGEKISKYTSYLDLTGLSLTYESLVNAVEEALNTSKPGFKRVFEYQNKGKRTFTTSAVEFEHRDTPIHVWAVEVDVASNDLNIRGFEVSIEVPYNRDSELWFDIERMQMAISERMNELFQDGREEEQAFQSQHRKL